MNPIPFEQADPELGNLMQWFVYQPTHIRRKVETIVVSEPKVGRNDPCPCGTGKKYKKCCGAGK